MKSLLTFLFLLLPFSLGYGQNKEVMELISSIQGQWSTDDNGNVTYQRIIEVPGANKEELYNRASSFFVYNYGSGQSVIQTQDKESGLIIGKGLFDNIHTFGNGFGWVDVSTWHIIRIDLKDGRARVLLTLNEYSEYFNGNNSMAPSSTTTVIGNQYPVNPEGSRKNAMGKSFYKSHLRAMQTMESVEKALHEGSVSKEVEGDDW